MTYDHRGVEDWQKDITTLLSGMRAAPGHPALTRCDCAIQLATKLLDPGFRLEFFAHPSDGIFDVMRDLETLAEPNLHLALAVLVLVLSTDNLRTNIDRRGLRLLAVIVENGPAPEGKVNKKVLEGVQLVVARSKLAKELSKEVITVSKIELILHSIV